MTTSPPGRAPAGWYADPSRIAVWRWWDGYAWTQHIPRGPSVEEQFAAEEKAVRWGKLAFLAYALAVLATLALLWATRSAYHTYFAHLRAQLRTHHFQSSNRLPATLYLSDLALLIQIPAYVGLLTWQVRAAKTARSLALPARRSPGLGAGSWFIPVVNFWFPYQAIRDCLPSGDRGRRAVAQMWTCFIVVLVSNVVASVLTFIGSPLGFLLGTIAFGSAVGFGLLGVRAVQAIFDAHGRLLALRQLDRQV